MSGEIPKIELTIPAETEYLDVVRGVIELVTEKVHLSKIERYKVILAVEEAGANIIKHAYRGRGDLSKGEVIGIKVFVDDRSLTIILEDKGVPFDRNRLKNPDLEKHLKECKTSGLGVYIIESLMDEVRYDINGVSNRIVLIKKLESIEEVTRL